MRATVLTMALMMMMLQMAQAQREASVVGYVAKVTGTATARQGSAAPRTLQRFSPLYLNDLVTPNHGGSVLVRFAYGEHLITDTTPAAERHVTPPAAPANDPKTRFLRALTDAQRRQFSKASQNVPTAARGLILPKELEAVLPRRMILLQGLRFQ